MEHGLPITSVNVIVSPARTESLSHLSAVVGCYIRRYTLHTCKTSHILREFQWCLPDSLKPDSPKPVSPNPVSPKPISPYPGKVHSMQLFSENIILQWNWRVWFFSTRQLHLLILFPVLFQDSVKWVSAKRVSAKWDWTVSTHFQVTHTCLRT